MYRFLAPPAHTIIAHHLIVPTNDLHFSRFPYRFIIGYAETGHIDAHIGGRLVGAFSGNGLKHGIEHREYFDIPVVIDRSLAIGLQMIGVDHVHVVEICGGRFIGQIHRVFQRQIPHRESFKLGIACTDTPFVLMVQLGQTHSHFAAARTGGRHHHQGTSGLHIFVFAVSLVADNQGHIGGVAGNGVMEIDLQSQMLQLGFELIRRRLAAIAGDDHTAHIKPDAPESIDQAKCIGIISDTQIAPDLVFLDVGSVDGHNHLGLIRQALKHAHFGRLCPRIPE